MLLQSSLRRAVSTQFCRVTPWLAWSSHNFVGRNRYLSTEPSTLDHRNATPVSNQNQSHSATPLSWTAQQEPIERSRSEKAEQKIRTRNRLTGNIAGAPETERFIGGLNRDIDEATLRSWLKEAGFEVVNIKIKISKYTHKNPGYAHVEFSSVEDANRAIFLLNGREFKGRVVSVQYTASRPEHCQKMIRAIAAKRTIKQDPKGVWYSERGQRVAVRGLPLKPFDQYFFRQTMQEFFNGFTIEGITAPKKSPTPFTYRFARFDDSYCFVDFATAQQAKDAVNTLNGMHGPWGSPLWLKIGTVPGRIKANVTTEPPVDATEPVPPLTERTSASTQPTLASDESVPIEPRPASAEPAPAPTEPKQPSTQPKPSSSES
ncbi:hypothetical protein BDW74DRAFT_105957 [Aspergillus multicolor]|uniref:uncharacterized protein n=1 Tax=Aspergillus multicolor TaxID=41759 RepID=UPI003CCD8599